ncbi:MAG: hypothetical protein V4710_24600 [Verrucomicrobiota bacterium]
MLSEIPFTAVIYPSPRWMRLLRVVLFLAAAMMVAPAIVHYGLVDERMGSQRLFGLLLPAQLLFVRFLAQLSICMGVVPFAAFISTYLRPNIDPGSIAIGLLALFAFSVFHLCYMIVIVATLL